MSKPKDERYTIAVDFDGVLHQYITPWTNAHTIADPPVEGAIKWLREMSKHFDIVIHSTRCRSWQGRQAIMDWLIAYGWNPLDHIRLSNTKPTALIYIDDRAWRFEGKFPTRDQVHAARPWNKPKEGSNAQV